LPQALRLPPSAIEDALVLATIHDEHEAMRTRAARAVLRDLTNG